MDLETENRIAAILMKEAAELRRQAEKEGVLAYLREPKLRTRPNSRFLSATVRGVQQANRVVEVNEMWKVRQKELELDDRCKGRLRVASNDCVAPDRDTASPCSSSRRVPDDQNLRDDGGLKDEDVDKFLHSRAKRGRGSIGSRMDETGPYLLQGDSEEKLSRSPIKFREERERLVLGPEKPSHLISRGSPEIHECRRKKAKKSSAFLEEEPKEKDSPRKAKKAHTHSSKKKCSKKHGSERNSKSRKHRSKDELRDDERKRKKRRKQED